MIAAAVALILHRLLLQEGWPQTHDHFRYFCLFKYFQEAFWSGTLYPRWLPDLYGGYGYPTFVFYQPLFFYVCLFFSLFTSSLKTALFMAVAFLFLAGGAGAYLMARQICGRACALFASLFFLITPYLYVNLYVRGDLSELASIMLLPWPIFLLLALKRRACSGRTAGMEHVSAGLILALAAVVTAHPATTIFLFPFLLFAGAVISIDIPGGGRKVFFKWLAVSVAMSVLLSSPYWLTAFTMKKYVHYEWALGGYFDIGDHAVYPSQLFSRFWDFGGSEKGSGSDGMSFQLGLPHFILALAGAFLGRRNRLILASFAAYAVCILLMLPPFLFFWRSLELLRCVQFPWRLLSIAALLQAICICGIGSICQGADAKPWIRRGIYAVYAVCILFALAWYREQFDFKADRDFGRTLGNILGNRLVYVNPFASANEMLPRTAKVQFSGPRGARPMVEVDRPGCRIEEFPDSSNFRGRFRISCATDLMLVVNQLYLPGWKVLLDDAGLGDEALRQNLLPDGRMQVAVPRGENHVLEFYYEGPPGWRLRNTLIVLGLAAFACFAAHERKKGAVRDGSA